MAVKLELKVATGPLAGKSYTVPPGGLRLGRSSSNDIHVLDEALSRNHCLFELRPDGEVRVMDLASANGTFVNGDKLGAEALALKAGDVVEAGGTRIEVVDPLAKPADLGLGLSSEPAAEGQPAAARPAEKRGAANIVLAAVALLLAGACAYVLFFQGAAPKAQPGGESPARAAASEDRIVSVSYEKVDADATHIFRYFAKADVPGTASVVSEDEPRAARRVEKSKTLSDHAAAELARIFDSEDWTSLDAAYTGPSSASANSLKSWRVKLVRAGSAKEVRVENTLEPKGFKIVREAVETLFNNELGVQSIQRSREDLLASSAHCEEVGDSKWEERDVTHGNLFEAIRLYSQAKNDLDTLGSETESAMRIQRKIEDAERELKARYEKVRFEAERASRIGDWEAARDSFRRICEMIPDKGDQRHSEANASMVDVEARMESAKKGGKRK